MTVVDLLASEAHYCDHAWPIWDGLAPHERGVFYAASRVVARYAAEHGYDAVLYRRQPPPSRTPIIVAGYTDLKRTGRRRAVLIEHGAGQNYSSIPSSPYYSGGANRNRVELFLTPNQTVADRNRFVYPKARHVVVGSARLERLAAIPRPDRGVVACSFHWPCKLVPEADTAWEHYRDELARIAAARDVELIGHAHPRFWAVLSAWWESIGVEPVRDFAEVVRRADVFVADNTSALYEWVALDRPVVVLNAPWYRRDVDHGLRFWDQAGIGWHVDDPADLVDAIKRADDFDPVARRDIAWSIFGQIPGSTARSIAAIRDLP